MKIWKIMALNAEIFLIFIMFNFVCSLESEIWLWTWTVGSTLFSPFVAGWFAEKDIDHSLSNMLIVGFLACLWPIVVPVLLIALVLFGLVAFRQEVRS